MVVTFDNVVIATKTWNMLFSVADWATATQKAAAPKDTQPSWRDTLASLTRNAAYTKYQREFIPSILNASDPGFTSNKMVMLASELLNAWAHGRWGIVAKFTPPILRGSNSDGQSARHAKETFERYALTEWTIDSMTYDQASTAEIRAQAKVNDRSTELRFRLVFWTLDGNVAIPGQDDGTWSLAVWAPNTYFRGAD